MHGLAIHPGRRDRRRTGDPEENPDADDWILESDLSGLLVDRRNRAAALDVAIARDANKFRIKVGRFGGYPRRLAVCALLSFHEMSRVRLFDRRLSRLAEPKRLFRPLPPRDIRCLARVEPAFRGILPEFPLQVAELAEIQLDHPFQIRNTPHPPRLVVFPAQLAHLNQEVDDADEPLLAEQL
jgi:hypothetical protein